MKAITYYEQLSDSMTVEELHQEFIEVLNAYGQVDGSTISNALFELSERQWNTFEKAEVGLQRDIGRLLITIWDDRDVDRAETLLGVVARLGLVGVLKQLQNRDPSLFSAEVLKAVKDAVSEFGPTVEDPYSGLKN